MTRYPASTLLVLLGLLWTWTAEAQGPGAQRISVEAVLNHKDLRAGQRAAVALVLDVKQGFHAQSSKPLDENLIPLRVAPAATPGITWYPPVYPEGHIEEYPNLGRLSVYTGRAIVYLPFKVADDAKVGAVELRGQLSYQICDDQTCFAPERRAFVVRSEISGAREAPEPNQPEVFKDLNPRAFEAAPPPPSAVKPRDAAEPPDAVRPPEPAPANPAGLLESLPTSGVKRLVSMHSAEELIAAIENKDAAASTKPGYPYILALGIAFVAGLIFNVMPCVLPVLPLKAYGFYEVSQHNRGKSLLLGAVFSAGLIAAFGVLAVFVLIFKSFQWSEPFANPWVAGAVAVILCVMGLGMLGLFNVNLPTGVYSFSPRHDTYAGNFLFGAFTAVLSIPCTAPLFPGLLVYANSLPGYLGVPAMMMVGVGMASPYLLLSAFPELARRMPRTGPWAEMVKQFLGFMLLGAAAYFAGSHLIEGEGFWWLVVAVAAAAALFLLMRTAQLSKSPGPVAAVSLLAVALVGVTLYLTGVLNVKPAVAAGGAGPVPQAAGLAEVAWQPYSQATLEAALKSGHPVMIKFTANWCGNCQWLERTVYKDPSVIAALAKHKVVPLKADLTRETAAGWPLQAKLQPDGGGIPLTGVFHPASKAKPAVAAR